MNGVCVRSDKDRCMEGSKWLGEGEVDSLTVQKP